MTVKEEVNERSDKFDSVISILKEMILDGLRHGFFEYSIVSQITKGGKREVVIKAGKSYKFYIYENELKND